MYLTRLTLDARSRDARAWLSDCHALHRMIMSGFPAIEAPTPRADLGVLFRVEPMTVAPYVLVLVQSRVKPAWRFETDAVVKIDGPKPLAAVLEAIAPGIRYRFRLRANPTRRVHRRATAGPDLERGRREAEKVEAIGKRVELAREDDQIAWLQRRAAAAGFRVLTVRATPQGQDIPSLLASVASKVTGRKDSAALTLGTILFEGLLEVTDASSFRNTLMSGLGPGKAFGCGLLSIASAR